MRRQLAAAALFLALAVLELWTPITHGGYFLPSDIGQVSPITRVGGATLAPKNPLASDVFVAFGPFLHYDVAQVAAGQFPTWNGYNGNGQPYFADDQTVLLSPFTLPFYVLNFRWALLAAALARLWVLGFVTYLLLARHRLGSVASAVGGAIFAYAGYHLVWLNYQTQVSVSATLVVALWCVRVALDHGPRGAGDDEQLSRQHQRQNQRRERAIRVFALVGLASALAVMVYDGHPETMIFDGLLVGGYAAVALGIEGAGWRGRLGWIARFGAAALLAGGLAAFQLLPFLQYVGDGARPTSLKANPAASASGFSFSTAPIMAFPNLFGGPQLAYDDVAYFSSHRPTSNYAEVNGNATGLLALCLVPLGLAAVWRRRRQAIAWFGVAATAIGAVFLYSRAMGLWWHDLPLVGTAGLNRSQDIFLLGVAVLAALGVDWVVSLVSGRVSRPRVRLATLGAVLGSFCVMTAVLWIGALDLRRLESHLKGKGTRGTAAAAAAVAHDNITAELLIATGFLVVLVVFVLSRHHLLRWPMGAGLIALAFVSNGVIMQSYNPTVPASLVYPHTSAVRDLARTAGSDEIVFTDNYFPAPPTNLWFGFHDIGSYDAIGFTWHDALYNKVFRVKFPYSEQLPPCLEGLQLFGVQWVVGGPGRFPSGSPDGLSLKAYLYKVPAYKVSGASLVSLVGRSATASGGDRRALATVSGCSFNPDRTVVLDPATYAKGGHSRLSAVTGTTSTSDRARVTARGAETLSVRTTSVRGGWLVIRQTYAPGWVATVDGRTETVHRADVAFQAVRVGAGTHTVDLEYRPGSIARGALISVLALVVTAGLLVLAVLWWRRGIRPGGRPGIDRGGAASPVE